MSVKEELPILHLSLPQSVSNRSTRPNRSAAPTNRQHRRPRERPTTLFDTVLKAAQSASIKVTIEMRNQQRVSGIVRGITPEQSIIMEKATIVAPNVESQPAPNNSIKQEDTQSTEGLLRITNTMDSNRSIKPITISVTWKIQQSFDQLMLHARHIRCIIFPAKFDVRGSLESIVRKQRKAGELYKRRKLNE